MLVFTADWFGLKVGGCAVYVVLSLFLVLLLVFVLVRLIAGCCALGLLALLTCVVLLRWV